MLLPSRSTAISCPAAATTGIGSTIRPARRRLGRSANSQRRRTWRGRHTRVGARARDSEEDMQLAIYQVDAFTDRLFGGNPAAVCPLEAWLPEAAMQAIAAEN